MSIPEARNGGTRAERAHFLFRSELGTIDAPTWRRHASWLLAAFLVLTMLWFVVRPYAHHDLAQTAFIAPMTIVAYAYVIVYAFAALLIAVCYVMLSMKRFRDRAEPTGLAGLVPLLAFLAASLHFLHAQTPDVIAVWQVVLLDLVLAGVAVWTVVELGVRPSRRSMIG